MLSTRSRNRCAIVVVSLAAAILVLSAFGLSGSAYADQAGASAGLTVFSSDNAKRDEKPIADGVYVISSAAKKSAVLEVAGGSSSSNAAIRANAADCTAGQRWRIKRLDDGFYSIVNVASGKALGIAAGKVANGTAVSQGTWKAKASQKWKITKDTAGFKLVSALSAKYTLGFEGGGTDDGAAAVMCKDRAEKAYRLRLAQVKPVAKDGIYMLSCKASGKKLQVAGGRVKKGANVQQGTRKNALERMFQLKFDEKTGYYRILAAASGLALEVEGGYDADYANVRVFTSKGTAAQRWAAVKNADGTVTFRSATGGRALDIEGASTSTGANAQIYAANGTDAQKFRLKAVSRWLPNGTYTFATAVDTGNMMAVKGASKAKGANVRTAARSTSKAQQWVLKYDKSAKAYTIRNKNSKCALEAAASARDGANVRQAKPTGKKAQLWIPTVSASGISFASAANPDVVLSVAGGGKSAGANILVKSDKGKSTQKFRLRDATLPTFKVFLNPGHGWNSNGNGAWDTGAQGNGHTEAEFTHDLARRVQAYCESYGIEVVNDEQYSLAYWDRMPKAVSLGCDAIVSIHFDWSGGGVSGTHTMVGVQGKAAGSDLLNSIIHRHLLAATGLRDLGTFSRRDITAVNGAIPSMLMEVGFMDNAGDVRNYLNNSDRIARGIADGIYEASLEPSLNR